MLLNQSDLLIVVWDGKRKGMKGGTEETFRESLLRGTPVVWVDAYAPHEWQLVYARDVEAILAQGPHDPRMQTLRGHWPDLLEKAVRKEIEVPFDDSANEGGKAHSDNPKRGDPRPKLFRFYAEKRPSRNPWIAWKLFRELAAKFDIPEKAWSTRVRPFEADVIKDWPHADDASPILKMVDHLRPYYAWPDKLSGLYADKYRSAFVCSLFLFSAAAVLAALLPILSIEPHGPHYTPTAWLGTACALAETGLIASVIALIVLGRVFFYWHERWLDYRIVAELIRHLRLIAPLGGFRPFPQIPAHWGTYGQPSASWMAWYVRAVERASGTAQHGGEQRDAACVARLHGGNRRETDRLP